MQHQSRRSFIANAAMALAAGAGAASTHPVFAQTATHLPEGIVNFILPVAPGGGTDLTFRALAEAT